MTYFPEVLNDAALVKELKGDVYLWTEFACGRYGAPMVYCIVRDSLDALIDRIRKEIDQLSEESADLNKGYGKSLYLREALEKHRFDNKMKKISIEALTYTSVLKCIDEGQEVTVENLRMVIFHYYEDTKDRICAGLVNRGVSEEDIETYLFDFMRRRRFYTKEMEEFIQH